MTNITPDNPSSKLNGYTLNRRMMDFAFQTKECKSVHIALFLFIVDLNNRLAWKAEFQLPTLHAMEVLSIGNRNTYLNAITDLEKWGFIEIVKAPTNQYQARVIKVCHIKTDKADTTALDTALIRQSIEQEYGTVYGNDTGSERIVKQGNKETIKTRKQGNKNSVSLSVPNESFDLSSNSSNLVFPFNSENFKNAWSVLLATKKWKNKSFAALQTSLKILSGGNEQDAIKMIENTIAGEWQGIFPLKEHERHKPGAIEKLMGIDKQQDDEIEAKYSGIAEVGRDVADYWENLDNKHLFDKDIITEQNL